MRKLLQVESIKTLSSNTFRTIIVLHLLLFILVILGIARIDFSAGEFSISLLYKFPHVWEFFAWIASWFNILLAILVIVLVCNEYRYNTFRQQVINGLSRGELVGSKLITIFYIAIYGLILVVGSSLVSGFITTSDPNMKMIFEKADVILVYFLQTIAYMSLGMLVAILLRNNGLSIVIFILYLFPTEVILRKWIFPQAEFYFPAKVISDLTPLPDLITRNIEQARNMAAGMQGTITESEGLELSTSIILSLAYFLVFTGVSYWVLKKRSI
jgi:hypothetical protein